MGISARPGIVNSIVHYGLTGGTAQVATRTVFDGLNWRTAAKRVDGSPHTLYQPLSHMIFWQDGVLDWLKGGSPSMPEHASDSWAGTAGPKSRAEWIRAVRHFRSGLTRLERAARRSGTARRGRSKSPLEMLTAVAVHNSYHAGQAALLRQLLGRWPPPSGGMSW